MAPGCKVEILTPDFRGQEMPLAKVIHERPDVFNHNVETVPRLYPMARRGSKFLRSARVLRMAKEMGGADVVTKSGLMVGLGESFEEMVETFGLLREHRVQVLTVGQYLRPTENHLPVVRYWHPEEFEALEKAAYELGFESVASGPLVRSSYHADQNLPESKRAESLLASWAPASPPWVRLRFGEPLTSPVGWVRLQLLPSFRPAARIDRQACEERVRAAVRFGDFFEDCSLEPAPSRGRRRRAAGRASAMSAYSTSAGGLWRSEKAAQKKAASAA